MKTLVAILTLLVAVTVQAADFKSATGKKAQQSYQANLDRLDKLYQKALGQAKDKYVEQLESARKTALIRNDLDEAQRLAEAKKELEAEDKTTSRSKTTSKQHWLVGTAWKYAPDGSVREWLPNNETIKHYPSGKTVPKDSWFALDDNRVLIVSMGRGKKLVAGIYAFAPDRKSCQAVACSETIRFSYSRVK